MKRVLIALLLIPLLSSECYAVNTEVFGIGEAEKQLPEDVRYIAGEIEADGGYDASSALSRLGDSALDAVKLELRKNGQLIASMLSIGLISALALTMCSDVTMKNFVNIIGVCSEAALLLGGMDSLIASITDTMHTLSNYSRAALPAVFTAAAISGAAVSASAKYGIVCMGLEVLISVSSKLIIPLVYVYIALSLSTGLYKNAVLEAAKRAVKWCTLTIMTAVPLIFSLLLNVTGAISGSADALAVKTARTVISSVLPVVGGIASDAASTVLSAASMVRASAGAMGMTAVCALCIAPFARLLVRFLSFKAGAAVCNAFSGGTVGGFLDEMGNASAMLMGLTGCECIMLFVSFSSAIKAVTGF